MSEILNNLNKIDLIKVPSVVFKYLSSSKIINSRKEL